MAEDFDFFAGHEEEDTNAPDYIQKRVQNLVREWKDLSNLIEDTERSLGELKAKRGEIEMKKIPDALLEAGLSEITTLDGLKVTTQLFVGTIPAEKKASAFAWLDEHGHSSIIKRQVSIAFDKGSTEQAQKAEAAIRELGLEPKTSLDVHPMTFKSFAKEQVNKGKPLPFDEWGVYYGQKAVIKG